MDAGQARIRLGAPTLDFYVDAELRAIRGRWLAVAMIGGDPEIGVGMDPVEALAASLACLGSEAAEALVNGYKSHQEQSAQSPNTLDGLS